MADLVPAAERVKKSASPLFVMAGPDPAIHNLLKFRPVSLDSRVKRGYDNTGRVSLTQRRA
jgi:hypothetical protein